MKCLCCGKDFDAKEGKKYCTRKCSVKYRKRLKNNVKK